MQKQNSIVYYSASDIANFLDCEHLTMLDLINLETPLPQAVDDDEAILYQRKGLAHEAAYLQQLQSHATHFADISGYRDNVAIAIDQTRAAMRDGADIIYQAALMDGCFIGHADFLKRVPKTSLLGDFSYEVIDTKLARSAKAKHLIQVCFYSELVATIQGSAPAMMHIILGDRREESFRFADYSRYYDALEQRFLDRVQAEAPETYPDQCERCDYCRWRNLCEERRLQDDHLSQVANITRLQIRKLVTHGVPTLEALAKLPKNVRIPKMATETLNKLRHQAKLQLKKRRTGEDHFDLLPLDPEEKRGFARLPKPDPGDIFFDVEGDPLEQEGLEYLFGIYYLERGKPRFRSFWAHSRDEERRAFEALMDFITGRMKEYPGAYIYHYAHYEETALKRLMSLHGTLESEVDNLLRFGKLVDLYKVVREAMRVSEPRYSLKHIEKFYMPARTGAITDAAGSIVFYERWKETGDDRLLPEIESYNRDDLRSTYELRQWLLKLRPDGIPWAGEPIHSTGPTQTDISTMNADEQRLAHYRELLVETLTGDREEWTQENHLSKLVFQLLDFHRRADKPSWWGLFSRQEMTSEELIEDVASIGGMRLESAETDVNNKRVMHCRYTYPDQDTKLKTEDNCIQTDTLAPVELIEIDEDNRSVLLRWPNAECDPPELLNIGPPGPIRTGILRNALFRFADNLINKEGDYKALIGIIKREIPRIKNRDPGEAIIDESEELMPQIIKTVANLDNSYIFIQGPPGSGKTWTGAHIIVELLKHGCRIGITSNSHKAINNLLQDVERVAKLRKITFNGLKKSVSERPETMFCGEIITDRFSNRDMFNSSCQLIAGTAWLFAAAPLDLAFDYLFVEEAGQVSLANLVATGTSSRNIVLLGDQMQLGQPIQGVHPGRSGESTLEYLLDGLATIPPERGIFLKTTWRMHHDVCRFISEAVYDGRLVEEPSNNIRRLILGKSAHAHLRPTGVCYIPVEHEGCSQRSDEEAALVLKLYRSLLKQRYTDKTGDSHPITKNNILVVAPYNMQVNLLRRTLPQGARVGTVDKFQGQEAEVVIISMATSSGDDLPRHIEFLYSKNRLNVAVSRAKCLAIIIANPALMAIRCTTPEQMALVNTICWAREYSISLSA